MADEIRLSLNVEITKQDLKLFFRPGTVTPDLSSNVHDSITPTCTGTATASIYTVANAASNGYAFFQNLMTTTTLTSDNVIFGVGSTAFMRLRPGDVAAMRLGTNPTSISVATGATGETVSYQAMFLSP